MSGTSSTTADDDGGGADADTVAGSCACRN